MLLCSHASAHCAVLVTFLHMYCWQDWPNCSVILRLHTMNCVTHAGKVDSVVKEAVTCSAVWPVQAAMPVTICHPLRVLLTPSGVLTVRCDRYPNSILHHFIVLSSRYTVDTFGLIHVNHALLALLCMCPLTDAACTVCVSISTSHSKTLKRWSCRHVPTS